MSDSNENPDPTEDESDLSDLGRNMMDSTAGSSIGGSGTGTGGTRWLPPTAEELATMLTGYEIIKMLGRGGMGAVYMGRQTSLDRPVAIKILSSELEDADTGFADRFQNEARAMAKLEHPGIVAVHDFGQTESGLLFIVMQYVDGTDVAQMIAADGRLHTEHAMAITAHVCDALGYAHDRGIIHRDIKPANIMVGYDGVVKVADFGLAKSHGAESEVGLTMSGMMMGTMHYMAPETMILGSSEVDNRADVYAVGVMLYHMLTGKVPQGMFELPSVQVQGLDPRYDGIIARAMREDRETRYQNARELRSDLDAILTQPVMHVEATPPAGAEAPAALPTDARPQRPGGKRMLVTGQSASPIRGGLSPERAKSATPWIWAIVTAAVLSAGGFWWTTQELSDTVAESVPVSPGVESSLPAPLPVKNSEDGKMSEIESTEAMKPKSTDPVPDNQAGMASLVENQDSQDGHWRSLFEENSLDGWMGDQQEFEIQSGILLATGKGTLRFTEPVGDFRLRFDLRLSQGAHAEISLRGQVPQQPNRGAPNASFGIVIRDESDKGHSNLSPWRKHGAIFGYLGPTQSDLTIPGEWIRHEISVIDQHVTVSVGGKLVQNVSLEELERQAPGGRSLDLSKSSGHLAILAFEGRSEFRDVMLQQVSPDSRAPMPPAPVPQPEPKPEPQSNKKVSESVTDSSVPGEWIDILAVIDPVRDLSARELIRGDGNTTWDKQDGELLFLDSAARGEILLPMTADTPDFELQMSFTRELGSSGIDLKIPVPDGGTAVAVGIRSDNNRFERTTLKSPEKGVSIAETEYAIETSKRTTLTFIARSTGPDQGIILREGDRTLIDWKGDYRSDLGVISEYQSEELGLWIYSVGKGIKTRYRFHEILFRSLSSPSTSLSSIPSSSESILGSWWQRIEGAGDTVYELAINRDGSCFLKTGTNEIGGRWESAGNELVFSWQNDVVCRFVLEDSESELEVMQGQLSRVGAAPSGVLLARSRNLALSTSVTSAASPSQPPEASLIPNDAIEFEGGLYKFFPSALTWKEARAKCEEMGGRLPVVKDPALHGFLAKLGHEKDVTSLWIGANDEEQEGTWLWLDGTPITGFKAWGPNQPGNATKVDPNGEDYLLMFQRRRLDNNPAAGWVWADFHNDSSSFVCEWKGGNKNSEGQSLEPDSMVGRWRFTRRDSVKASTVLELLPDKTAIRADTSWQDIGRWSLSDQTLTISWQSARVQTVKLSPRNGDDLFDGVDEKDGPLEITRIGELDTSAIPTSEDLEGIVMNCAWKHADDPGQGKFMTERKLAPDGKVESNDNAYQTWALANGKLIIFNHAGRPSITYDSFYEINGTWIMQGRFWGHHNISHIMRQINALK